MNSLFSTFFLAAYLINNLRAERGHNVALIPDAVLKSTLFFCPIYQKLPYSFLPEWIKWGRITLINSEYGLSRVMKAWSQPVILVWLQSDLVLTFVFMWSLIYPLNVYS